MSYFGVGTDDKRHPFCLTCGADVESPDPLDVAAVDTIQIRTQDGELDEVVAHNVDVHLEQMDHGHWWLKIGGVAIHLTTARPSRTKIRGRWEDEAHVDVVTVDGVPR